MADDPGVGDSQSTLRRLRGVVRPQLPQACGKGVGAFPAKGYVVPPEAFGFRCRWAYGSKILSVHGNSAPSLLFSGRFRAFDKDPGDGLWVTKLPASGMATPMTYLGKKAGKQFVVIAAGGGNKYDKEFTLDSPYSAFASSSRCFSNWAVHVATGPRTVPNASPVS